MEKANLFSVSKAILYEAAVLMKRRGFTQAETARELGLTPAAISQYLGGLRGGKRARALKPQSKERLRAIIVDHYRMYPMVPADWPLSKKLCAVLADEVC